MTWKPLLDSPSTLYTVPFVSNSMSKDDWKTFFENGLKECFKEELQCIEWTEDSLPTNVHVPTLVIKQVKSEQEFYTILSTYSQIPIYYSSLLDASMVFLIL